MESSEAISAFDDFRPDLVLLDLRMPGVDVGFEVLSQIGLHTPHQGYLPVVVLTAEQSQAAKQKALLLGAKDIITKPFCNAEVVLRVSTLLETRFLHREIEQQNQMLDQKVRERIRDLENAQIEILHRLALAAEYRHDNTGLHTHRVGELAASFGRSLNLPEQNVELIRIAAPLHDVGKIGIPDRILLKPEKLTAEEYERIKTHTSIGARMLSGSRLPCS